MTDEGTGTPVAPTKHVRRVIGALILIVVAGLVLQRLLQPEGYGEGVGPRAGSIDEILAREPVFKGKLACVECHQEIFGLHEKDIHYDVECEDCHGPGNEHIAFHGGGGTAPAPEAARMPKEYTLEGCLFCHRRLAARPRSFPQIDPAEHYSFLKVVDPEVRCVECHDPHEPIFLLTEARKARIHPVIHECESCHETAPEEDHAGVPGHPVIFTCRDCHTDVVADFASRKHSFMRCTACHLYHEENETAGRIFKNGNRRFCLLCHEAKSFKDPAEMPQIVWEVHLAEMAKLLEKDLEVLTRDPRACLKCHYKLMHDHNLMKDRR